MAASAAGLLAAAPPPSPQLVLLTFVAVLVGLFGGSARLAPGALTGPSSFRRYEMSARDDTVVLGEGENLEVDPPRRLVQSFRALWSEDVKAEGTSTVTWEIGPVGDSCRLTVTHRDLREGANGGSTAAGR